MIKNKLNRMAPLLIFIFLAACGGGGGGEADPISFSETTGETGYVQLNVHASKSPALSEAAVISEYKVMVIGDGFAPIERNISGTANGVVIDGIPVGESRTITISALNSSGKSIREGMVEHLAIDGGKMVSADVTLESIPVVLNLSDGGYLSNQRLYFKVLTDPGHAVSVENGDRLRDIATSADEVAVNLNGETQFYLGIFSAGDQTFLITDLNTRKTTRITLHLWDGSGINGAPLFSSSNTSSARLGQSLGQSEAAHALRRQP